MIGFVFQILAKSSNPQFEVPPSRLIKVYFATVLSLSDNFVEI